MELKPLDWTPFERGMADTWMGGEPDAAATVCFEGRDDYPDHVVAWISTDNLAPKEMNDYAALFAAAPDLLAACEAVLESLQRNLADDLLPETKAALAAAIAKAKGE